jgi:LacI family transcriptional regulator
LPFNRKLTQFPSAQNMTPKPSPPTLKDVAALAGVHYTTVSLALRNSPQIPESTRLRIQKIAAATGYRPNPLVSALMRSRRIKNTAKHHGTLAFLTRYPEPAIWQNNPFLGGLFRGAAQAAEAQGYSLTEFWLGEAQMSGMRGSRILAARGIHGLIVPPLSVAQGHLRLDWSKFAAVALGYSLRKPELHRVAHAHYVAMTDLLRHAWKLGYRRIGLVLSRFADRRTEGRWHGAYTHFFVAKERTPLIPLFHEQWEDAVFDSWMQTEKPQLIVTTGKSTADVLAALEKSGARIPGDVGVADLMVENQESGISGIYQAPERIGRVAGEQLIAMLHRNENGIPECPPTVLVPGEWIRGSTL